MSRLSLLALLLCVTPAYPAETPVFKIRVDVSAAPELTQQAEQSRALCEEWYPKINEILKGPGHELPFREVLIIFAPLKGGGTKTGTNTFALTALTKSNVIGMPSNWLKEERWDYRALLIHELTHVCQNYGLRLRCTGIWGLTCYVRTRFTDVDPRLKWLTEGIAEFVSERYWLKATEPKLRMDSDGYLTGYDDSRQQLFSLQQRKVKLASKGYVHGYSVAASFLLWLEQNKDKNIIRNLNLAMSDGHCKPSIFQRLCGVPLDELWQEFIQQSMPTESDGVSGKPQP